MSLTTYASYSQCSRFGSACGRVRAVMGMHVTSHINHVGHEVMMVIRATDGTEFLSKGFSRHQIDSATDWLNKQVNDYVSWK